MDKQFRVCKETYHDAHGNIQNEVNYVQQLKSFLGIKYWKNVSTYFDTYFEAYELAAKLKAGDGKYVNKWKKEIVSYH